jgi:outer membrane lipoprotein SlyB
MDSLSRKGGLLYPMLLAAAVAVILFSGLGIATMLGWMPRALSGASTTPPAAVDTPPDAVPAMTAPPSAPAEQRGPASPSRDMAGAPPPCGDCGVVESIRAVETQGPTSWLGAAGGALVGGLIGNQVGRGHGRSLATVAGAGAGAYAGNEIEKNVNRSVRYQVRVRMQDGSLRTFHEAAQPGFAVGQKVRVTSHGIVPAGRSG